MIRSLFVFVGLAVVLAGFTLPVSAQGTACCGGGGGECVADAAPQPEPYVKDQLYMSPVGYVRWIHFLQTKVWLTFQQAAALLAEKGAPTAKP
jgi:hypothetical protein